MEQIQTALAATPGPVILVLRITMSLLAIGLAGAAGSRFAASAAHRTGPRKRRKDLKHAYLRVGLCILVVAFVFFLPPISQLWGFLIAVGCVFFGFLTDAVIGGDDAGDQLVNSMMGQTPISE